MDKIDPFQSNDFHCHSKFRPPDIEAVEFKARRVWPDWDDFPPYQDQNIENINSNYNKNFAGTNERAKKRYNMEIKKTQDEIEEMTKRFRIYDYNYKEPKPSINTNYRSFEFFQTNQNFAPTRRITTGSTINNNYYYKTDSINDNNYNLRTDSINANNLNNYNSISVNDAYLKDSLSIQSQFQNQRSHVPQSYKYYNQSYSNNTEKNGDDVDYEITSAATLEANLLRKQNEAMRKRIAFLKQKLEAKKKENKVVLKKIEESEIDRHQMADYLNINELRK